MKFAIFGAGGVGGYFGGRLAQAGQDVTFIARGAHLAAITESGLKVDSTGGDFVIKPANAADSPQSVGRVDVILFAVKAWQMNEAIQQMKPLVGDGTLIIPLLNGMEHMDALLAAFGREHVLGGLCRISSFVAAPGHIKHVAVPPFIAFGEWNKSKSARVGALLKVFEGLTAVKASAPEDIELAMWEKYLMICAYSGVGAVTRQPVGVFRGAPETRNMFRHVLEEVVAVANARGVMLSEQSIQGVMDRMDVTQPDVMASMQKDVMEGRPSELDAQIGALIRMARMADLSLPANEFIYASLLPMELKARGM